MHVGVREGEGAEERKKRGRGRGSGEELNRGDAETRRFEICDFKFLI
jgi:hypothetical protein